MSDDEKVRRLAHLATHASTPEHEANAAARALAKIIERDGAPAASSDDTATATLRGDLWRLRQETDGLRRQLQDVRGERDRALAAVEQWKADREKVIAENEKLKADLLLVTSFGKDEKPAEPAKPIRLSDLYEEHARMVNDALMGQAIPREYMGDFFAAEHRRDRGDWACPHCGTWFDSTEQAAAREHECVLKTSNGKQPIGFTPGYRGGKGW